MSENNKWSIKKKFKRGEVMIVFSRFCVYDKNEYGDLVVNGKEAEIVRLSFELYLMAVGSTRIASLLDYLGVPTVIGGTWEGGIISGMIANEKYKGDFLLQKYYTPPDKRNFTRKNEGKYRAITFQKTMSRLFHRKCGGMFFVKYFSLKKASKFPFFSKEFSLLSAGVMHPCS